MRALRENLRVENESESSEGENEIEIKIETSNFQAWGSDLDLKCIFYDSSY